MEYKKVTPEMRIRLRAPLHSDAVKQNPSKKHLSTIKPIFVTERLNDVFGIGSWQLRTEQIAPIVSEMKKAQSGREYNEFTALMKTTLTIPEYGIYYECIAGSTNEDEGDSAKGGTTDGLTKICSWMEIGINVFKGLGNIATEPSIEEGVSAILGAKNREEIDAAWKLYPQLRCVDSFKQAAKVMSTLYPKEEAQTPPAVMVEEAKQPEIIEAKAEEVQPEPEQLSEDQKLKIMELLQHPNQTEGNVKKVTEKLSKGMTVDEADATIQGLEKRIKAVDAQKQAEAKTATANG